MLNVIIIALKSIRLNLKSISLPMRKYMCSQYDADNKRCELPVDDLAITNMHAESLTVLEALLGSWLPEIALDLSRLSCVDQKG